MRSFKRNFVLGILFCISWFAGQSQGKLTPGYIITNKMDTVRGFILKSSQRNNHTRCAFRKTKEGDTQVFTPGDLYAYWITGDISYERKMIKGKDGVLTPVFAEALVKGKASLYEIYEEFYLQRDSLRKIEQGERLVSLPGAPPMWVKTKRYTGLTRALTVDCPPANVDFAKMKYKPKDFVKVTEAYNKCLQSDYHSFKQGLASNKTTYRLIAGLNSPHVSFDFLPKKTLKSAHSVFAGVGLELSSPSESWKTAFIVELWFSKLTVEGTYSYPFGAYTRHDNYRIAVNMIRLPFGLKHYLGSNSYIKGGGAFMAMKNNGSKIVEVFETSSSSVTYHEKFDKISVGQISIWGSIGLEKKISKGKKFQAELQYEQGTGIARRTQFDNSYGNAVLLVGISF
jgi:hypothetical protein